MKSLLLILATSLLLTACDDASSPSSDQVQRHQQEQLSAQSNSSVGMPAIINFQEKRMLKTILELRDTVLTTFTYTQDLNGNLHKLCDSVGYGLPYATQYTNPLRTVEGRTQGEFVAINQADPNGLFSPANAEGTWILCQNPNKAGEVKPVYVEQRIIVSPFALK